MGVECCRVYQKLQQLGGYEVEVGVLARKGLAALENSASQKLNCT
jgi:hypothetical protein